MSWLRSSLAVAVAAALLAWKLRLRPDRTVLVLLAGTIPVLTFVVERWLTRRYINPALAAEAASGRPAEGAARPARTG